MKLSRVILAGAVAASLVLPVAALADDSYGRSPEPTEIKSSETPEPSDTPDISETPEPSDTPEVRRTGSQDYGQEKASKSGESDREESPSILVPAELERDAHRIASADSHIDEISVASGSREVEVRVKQPARLFGIFPVTYRIAFKVNPNDKTVVVSRPWWLLFATDNADQIASAVTSQEKLLTQSTNLKTVLTKLGDLLRSLTQ